MTLDRKMLANDLADILSETHGVNVDSEDVLRGLDAFLKAIEPPNVHDALFRVDAFLCRHQEQYGARTDELADQVSRLDDERLLVSDLRSLMRAVRTDFNTRSLREKLTEQGHLGTPAQGVTGE